MTSQLYFSTGQHLAAARAFAGLKQSELAAMAGLHVNSLKRLEAMANITGSEHACHLIGEALKARGIVSQALPVPAVMIIRPTVPNAQAAKI